MGQSVVNGAIDETGRTFWAGSWRTPEGLKRWHLRRKVYEESEKGRNTSRVRNQRNMPRRVYVGEIYVGMAPTPEDATRINDETRKHFARKETT